MAITSFGTLLRRNDAMTVYSMFQQSPLLRLLLLLVLLHNRQCDAFSASPFVNSNKPSWRRQGSSSAVSITSQCIGQPSTTVCLAMVQSRSEREECEKAHTTSGFRQVENDDRPLSVRHSLQDPVDRRGLLTAVAAAGLTVTTTLQSAEAATTVADLLSRGGGSSSTTSSFTPALRPTAYRVDSTIPPTLLPVATARAQLAVLRDLGLGLGTDKKAVFIDTLNLNNMLQKAVYGTADAISNLGKGNRNTQAPASFVCLGLPMQPSVRDAELTVSLLQSMWGLSSSSSSSSSRLQSGNPKRALGLAFVPFTLQTTLDDLVANRLSLSAVRDILIEQQVVSSETWSTYAPLFEFAARNQIALLALGIAIADRATVLKSGLQSVDPDTRALYVADPEGFIATTTDPAFKLYTDRSLLKDFPDKTTVTTGNFFAERILVHEAAATLAATYALERGGSGPGTVVAIVAPMNDVRYLQGINGRLPRVYQYLANRINQTPSAASTATVAATASLAADFPVTNNDVTTILLNPTAADTLSRAVRLRLEIGTGPETLEYQSKIADYLWFSASPAVSLLPRVMEY